jgi:hypothetical protein
MTQTAWHEVAMDIGAVVSPHNQPEVVLDTGWKLKFPYGIVPVQVESNRKNLKIKSSLSNTVNSIRLTPPTMRQFTRDSCQPGGSSSCNMPSTLRHGRRGLHLWAAIFTIQYLNQAPAILQICEKKHLSSALEKAKKLCMYVRGCTVLIPGALSLGMPEIFG